MAPAKQQTTSSPLPAMTESLHPFWTSAVVDAACVSGDSGSAFLLRIPQMPQHQSGVGRQLFDPVFHFQPCCHAVLTLKFARVFASSVGQYFFAGHDIS